jgi:hypothetical protein
LVDDKTSDSDVKIIPDSGTEIPLGETPAIDSGTESDVRLDLAGAVGSKRKLESDSFLTEEIDLDAELRKAEEAARAQRGEVKPPKVKGKTPPPTSPFELSEMDLHLPAAGAGTGSTEGLARRIQEDSSDFDLTLDPSDNLSPLEPSSGEHSALSDSAIGQASARRAGSQDSGINLEEPSDAGISLESETTSSQDIDFELSVDEPPARKSSKKRAEAQEKKPDSSSEFELTLDDSVRLAHDNIPTDSIRVESARLAQGPASDVKRAGLDSAPLARGDSSRRDSARQSARLDSAPLAKGDSSRRGDSAPLAKGDSNKKKSISQQDSVRVRPKALDSMRVRDESARLADSSRLVPVDDDGTALKPEESGEDIFETDFEVPALEAESGSEVVPLDESDTDLESSDFDLALSDDDIATQSSKRRSAQVVPVDEEDVDEGAATISKKRSFVEEVDEDSGETAAVAEMEEEADETQVTPSRRKAVLVPAAPADWGVFAPVTLMVSTLFMFFVALMSIELMNGMWGFHQPTKASNLMIKAIGGMIPGVDSKDLERD